MWQMVIIILLSGTPVMQIMPGTQFDSFDACLDSQAGYSFAHNPTGPFPSPFGFALICTPSKKAQV